MSRLRRRNEKNLENYLGLKNHFVSKIVISEVIKATIMGHIKERKIVLKILLFRSSL
ncbi:hypothetical protein LCGT_1125 [Lactococcus garvieae ATCC 49156]|uniref:Uncharacterized protein n=1 Tax=Lactococcus garvieae (strain Lg2) TaxID=420890 RepID=F9VE54_LACGL|nr:hypothetical protein LCGT_1125 [Lactococcus garvieae ATCC 49156]BAK60605.1 hypothetical protein LCGL_1145 [Lactococcus garvieae Lg2]